MKGPSSGAPVLRNDSNITAGSRDVVVGDGSGDGDGVMIFTVN